MKWGAGTVQSGKSPMELSENIPNLFSTNTGISTRQIPLSARSRQLPSWINNHLLQYNYTLHIYWILFQINCRSQWLRIIRRRSAAARMLRLRVRIPRGHWCLSLVSVVSCQVDILSDGPIPCQKESYRLWCVAVCDLETSRMRTPWHALDCTSTWVNKIQIKCVPVGPDWWLKFDTKQRRLQTVNSMMYYIELSKTSLTLKVTNGFVTQEKT